MNNVKRKGLSLVLIGMLIGAILPLSGYAAEASAYSDVPKDSWALQAIKEAEQYGLMHGQAEGNFGYGKTITKAEFATILCNMMKWQPVNPAAASFRDVSNDKWYFSQVETALINGAFDNSGAFLPDNAITREEMAVMFVRALGLSEAAKIEEKSALPFNDITSNKGYIGVAYSIGMINGTSKDSFSPKATAKREEAAAMLSRIYAKYYGSTNSIHGFYAISSYGQKDLINEMEAVTFGWSRMENDDKGVWLNTSGENGNEYKIPTGYGDILSYTSDINVKAHLGVYMDNSGGVKDMLTDLSKRQKAVEDIIKELERSYEEVGKNPFSGVTIDFEGLKGNEAKDGFTAFLADLSQQLKSKGKTLYVAVQPALPEGVYFDGFDYKRIGELADKVILMAHDYNPTSLDGYTGTQWHKNAALTPIGSVYYSLKAATDKNTGVADRSKLVLAISFGSVGWELDKSGNLLSPSPLRARTEAVHKWMTAAGTEQGFSRVYRNPYLEYTTPEGRNMFLWYENGQSVFEKAALARLMGINDISVWRLGLIPNYNNYTVMENLK